jgi:redox-sensing transcriptional repressor
MAQRSGPAVAGPPITPSPDALRSIPMPSLRRLPRYYQLLRHMYVGDNDHITSAQIAAALDLEETQVRKDIAATGFGGKPKRGFHGRSLLLFLEQFLGLSRVNEAVLIGAGNLGRALLNYGGFAEFGLNISAVFDTDATKIGTLIAGRRVYHVRDLTYIISRLNIRLAIITVPGEAAQDVADALVAGGTLAIWNFSPVHLRVPETVRVFSENLAVSLATLSHYLAVCDVNGSGAATAGPPA